MRDKFTLHLFYLFVGVATSAFFIFYFKYNTAIQLASALLGCIYYIVWGIMHHASTERLNRLIVLEYVLFGSLIFLLLLVALTI